MIKESKTKVEISVLAPINTSALALRLGIALLAGIIVGIERELRGKAAGLRTYMLVCLGAAFFVLVPIQLGVMYQSADAFSRIIQGIITGIGFIGGGVILHRSRDAARSAVVQGLTSAATIWVAAALGIAAGCGLWELTLIGAGITLFILRVVKQLEPT